MDRGKGAASERPRVGGVGGERGVEVRPRVRGVAETEQRLCGSRLSYPLSSLKTMGNNHE